MEASPETRSPSRHWDNLAPVLEGDLGKRATAKCLPNPKFGEGVWDLRARQFRPNLTPSSAILNFDRRFPDPTRHLTARELVFQRLNRPVPPILPKARNAKVSLETASQIMVQLTLLYRFIDMVGVPRLDLLTQAHFDAFARYLTEERGADRKYAANTLCILFWLYESRHLLTADRVVVMPWNGTSPWKVLNLKRSAENLTLRIPEQVLKPLLGWALLYVDVFSHDIIEAYETQANFDNPIIASERILPNRNSSANEKLGFYFSRLKQDGKKVPRHIFEPNSPNHIAICSAAGIKAKSLSKENLDLIDKYTSDIGLSARSSAIPHTILSGIRETWRPPLGGSRDLEAECRHLTAACYIVCAYLSGMRDSEVQAMKYDCHLVSRDALGNVIRHYVQSLEYKGKSASGVERTWVVIDQVVQAIETMKKLGSAYRSANDTDILFVRINRNKADTIPSLKVSANNFIEDFIRHVNELLVPWGGVADHPAIPIDTFQRITTRMFRRTVAWFIANRPFGVVAGMIQYGHVSSQMFEGYAGTSESGFRQEVEAERACARQGDIVEMYEDFKRGVSPAGPKAEELVNQFEDVRELTDDFPGKVVDQARREKMLANLRKNLHPGVMADCFFEPANARCLSHLAEGERSDPVSGICDPHCTNACWLKKHLPVWERSLEDVERLSKRNRISPIQRDILNRRKAEYRLVITAIREASHDRAQ